MKVFRVAILTAKEVEFDAVRQHLVDERRIDDTFDGTVYRRAKIRCKIGDDTALERWDVAVYRTGRGQQPTTYGTQWLERAERWARGQPNPVENGPKPGMSGAHLAALKMAAYFSAAPKRSRKFRTSRAIPASYEAAHKGRPDDPGLPVRGFA